MDFVSKPAAIIPTYNRLELLIQVIESVLGQTVPCEIFVMDDASTDGTSEVIPKRFPEVRYHREGMNKGPTFQRNKAAALTEAEILFTIDDDCILQSPHTVEQTLAAFDSPRVGAVTIPFVNVLEGTRVCVGAANDGRRHVVFDFLGGMIAFRRKAYMAVGGYREFYFFMVEEGDLAVRLFHHGYVVRLGWADPLHHLESPRRNRPRQRTLLVRNNILWAFYNVPWPYFPLHLGGTIVLNAKNCLLNRQPLLFLKGLGLGMSGMWNQRGQRAPVRRETYRLVRAIRREGPIDLVDVESRLPPIA